MKTLVTLLFGFLALCIYGQNNQNVLIKWNFEINGSPTLAPTYISDTSLSVNPVAYSDVFSYGSGFIVGVSEEIEDRASITRDWAAHPYNPYEWIPSAYIEFRFFQDINSLSLIDSISFWWKKSASGPKILRMRSHINNYSEDIDSVLALEEVSTIWQKWVIDFNPFFTQDSQVTFRLYGSGAYSSSFGTLAIDSVTIYGQVSSGKELNAKLLLSGSYDPEEGLMHDSLRAKGLIPLQDPYGFGENVNPPVFQTLGSNAIVDWIVLGLRSPLDSLQNVVEKPFLVQRDGDIVGLDGNSKPRFSVPSGDYYVFARHRNHLPVMTSYLVGDTVDFTSLSTPVIGVDSRKLVNGVALLWEGDVTGDGDIKYVGLGNDRDEILQSVGGSSPNNVVTGVYTPKDVNLDGVVKYIGLLNDRDPILVNVGGDTPNAVRSEQVP